MTEEKKIENTSTLDYGPRFSALSARERYDFARFLAKHGANFRTALDRIMYRGFDEWERVGVREIMRDKGYINCTPQHCFIQLGQEGRAALYVELTEMGMCRNTAKRRFSTDSFKEWELAGVDALFAEWYNACHSERSEESHRIVRDPSLRSG